MIDSHLLTIALAQPTSEEEIQALTKGIFYSFSDRPSNLKQLDLWGCGPHHENNWGEHPERMEGLLAAMAKTPIKHSLETIYIDCRVSEEQAREMLDRHGFTNIKDIYD
jgi:hypothetical protein